MSVGHNITKTFGNGKTTYARHCPVTIYCKWQSLSTALVVNSVNNFISEFS